MKSILCFLKRVYGFVIRKVYLIWDSRLRSTINVKEFGKKGEGSIPEPYTVDGVTYQPRKTYNFWEATNGKGTLTIGDF